jgi:hypothetical protein
VLGAAGQHILEKTKIYPKITPQRNIAIWMRKNYKSKYCNPNDPDISISIHRTDRKGISCTISQENIPIFLKSTKT